MISFFVCIIGFCFWEMQKNISSKYFLQHPKKILLFLPEHKCQKAEHNVPNISQKKHSGLQKLHCVQPKE